MLGGASLNLSLKAGIGKEDLSESVANSGATVIVLGSETKASFTEPGSENVRVYGQRFTVIEAEAKQGTLFERTYFSFIPLTLLRQL
jgi:hypothetical protein